MEVSNISIISRGDMYKDVRVKGVRDNKHRKRRDKDVEANYTETEDSTEDNDKFDSSPKNITRSKRLVYIYIYSSVILSSNYFLIKTRI